MFLFAIPNNSLLRLIEVSIADFGDVFLSVLLRCAFRKKETCRL